MPRKSSVWFRKEDGFFYTTIRRKQIKLSKDRKESERAFHALLAAEPEPEEEGAMLRPSFRKLADDFLARSKEDNAAATFETHRKFLQSFCDHVKQRRAPDLKAEHATAWLKANPGWGQSTRALATQIVKAVLNRAVEDRKLTFNPLARVKNGRFAKRERILTQEERQKIRERVTGRFRDFLFALEQTGGRPFSEVAKITADMVNWQDGSITFITHKTAKKGKRRTIYLTPELQAVLRGLAEKHPTGPLFRNNQGNPWDRNNSHRWMRVFRRELGMTGITAYSWRHSYICDALERGVPLPIVAELVGNSVQALIKYYIHMGEKKNALKAAALKAIAPTG